ncbi:TetR family transcriptional regulator [Reticulibacter mediterranei]|uniref:TetR family transcriptional regulator n=1 Tax=Reticulibacter mediterranei TaxID=2778369 RepID=A0A8J3IWM6_9CHLR|nr:TetR/AcrR family transcriptional regulator [Reticulibacter mediterranei]GHO98187.1 TetR family transcriptional regulator [Reticulibacter mediterranei]
MNVQQTVDRRVQRTRRLLHEALFHLIIVGDYEHITIQDITEQANLGRTTFYLHYKDKEELLRESIRALLHDMQLEVEPDETEQCTFQVLSSRIFQHVKQRQHLYRAMLKESGPTNNLGEVMRNYFIELCQRFLQQQQGPLNLSCIPAIEHEIFVAHAAGSLFGLISWWLNHEVSPSSEEMGTIFFQLMTGKGR